MDSKTRYNNLLSIAEECQDPERLMSLVESEREFVAYNGFEPSGRMHIAQALLTVMNTNTIIENGGRMIIYIADRFAKLNHKLDGDGGKISTVGEYLTDVQESTSFMSLMLSEFIQTQSLCGPPSTSVEMTCTGIE